VKQIEPGRKNNIIHFMEQQWLLSVDEERAVMCDIFLATLWICIDEIR